MLRVELFHLHCRLEISQGKIHTAFCDSVDTPTIMEELKELISKANVYINGQKSPNPAVLQKIAKYITKILQVKEANHFFDSKYVNFKFFFIHSSRPSVSSRATLRSDFRLSPHRPKLMYEELSFFSLHRALSSLIPICGLFSGGEQGDAVSVCPGRVP